LAILTSPSSENADSQEVKANITSETAGKDDGTRKDTGTDTLVTPPRSTVTKSVERQDLCSTPDNHAQRRKRFFPADEQESPTSFLKTPKRVKFCESPAPDPSTSRNLGGRLFVDRSATNASPDEVKPCSPDNENVVQRLSEIQGWLDDILNQSTVSSSQLLILTRAFRQMGDQVFDCLDSQLRDLHIRASRKLSKPHPACSRKRLNI